MLEVGERTEPGLSLTRGRVLRNLHQPTLKLAKLDLKEKRIGMPEFMRITKQSVRNMKEAVQCLEDFDLFYVASANMQTKSS